MAQNVGWRYIFFISAVVSLIGMLMVRGTPESKAETKGSFKFDTKGVAFFMIAMVALQIVATQGSKIGWSSPLTLGLAAIAVIFGWLFIRTENSVASPFVNFKLFKNTTYTGATISNFLINGTAGALTNLNATLSAPQGWSGVLTPQGIGSIPPGGTAEIRARVVPPPSIPASEYRFSVRVVADQAEKTDEYRVIVHEQSLVPLLGVLMLVAIAGGTWFLFRRYRRR